MNDPTLRRPTIETFGIRRGEEGLRDAVRVRCDAIEELSWLADDDDGPPTALRRRSPLR